MKINEARYISTRRAQSDPANSTIGKDNSAMTHINLNEDSLEGLKNDSVQAFAVQYHPEASPGPHDAAYLFNQFAEMMKHAKA